MPCPRGPNTRRRGVLEAAREARQIVTTPDEVWSQEELAKRFSSADPQRMAYLLCARDGTVVGVLGLARGDGVGNAHTAEFGVTAAARARGTGVGTALVRAAEERARAWGVRKLCLGVFADNEPARALYARLGFEEEGARRGYYLVGGVLHDEVLMCKWLRA